MSNLYHKKLKIFQDIVRDNKCPNFKDGACSIRKDSKCRCDTYAEILVTENHVLPREEIYRLATFSMLDGRERNISNGQATGNKLLKSSVLVEIKEKLSKYFWDNNLPTNIDDEARLVRSSSCMLDRMKKAQDLMIYDKDVTYRSKNSYSIKKTTPRKGKTLIASVAMRHAIYSIGASNDPLYFKWIKYPRLISMLKDFKDMDNDVDDCMTADWLVIDDIYIDQKATAQNRAFIKERFDYFLSTRKDFYQKPTIFVCNLSLDDEEMDLQDILGVTIDNIYSSCAEYQKISL